MKAVVQITVGAAIVAVLGLAALPALSQIAPPPSPPPGYTPPPPPPPGYNPAPGPIAGAGLPVLAVGGVSVASFRDRFFLALRLAAPPPRPLSLPANFLQPLRGVSDHGKNPVYQAEDSADPPRGVAEALAGKGGQPVGANISDSRAALPLPASSGRLRPSEPVIGPAKGRTRWTGYGDVGICAPFAQIPGEGASPPGRPRGVGQKISGPRVTQADSSRHVFGNGP